MSELVDGGRAAVAARDWSEGLALLREADDAGGPVVIASLVGS